MTEEELIKETDAAVEKMLACRKYTDNGTHEAVWDFVLAVKTAARTRALGDVGAPVTATMEEELVKCRKKVATYMWHFSQLLKAEDEKRPEV